MRQIQYVGPSRDATILVEDGDRIWLRRLCGLTCGSDGEDTGPAMTQGPAVVVTNQGRFEAGDFKVVEKAFDEENARMVWSAANGALRLESNWSFCPRTGVISRKDRITNAGDDAVTICRFHARFAFSPSRYEVYAQDSHWCNENQGRWIPLHAGSLRFGCIQGRTTQGGTPYLCLRRGCRSGHCLSRIALWQLVDGSHGPDRDGRPPVRGGVAGTGGQRLAHGVDAGNVA